MAVTVESKIGEDQQVFGPIVSATIEHSAFSQEIGEHLRERLAELGPGRVLGRSSAAADGVADIVVVVQWVGTAFVAGFVGKAGADFYDKLKLKLAQYVREARELFPYRPTLGEIRLEFDDLDVVIEIARSEEMPDFGELALLLQERLLSGRLRESAVVEVIMPMMYVVDRWEVNYLADSLDEYGVWGVTGIDGSIYQRVYDAVNDEWLGRTYA